MTQPPNFPKGVGLTALGIAQIRAAESRRPDALFHDPLAAAFVAAAGDSLPWAGWRQQVTPGAEHRWAVFADYVAVRTRFFDDCCKDASDAGCRQLVVLGAGLDARAFRLAWPSGIRLFELDKQDVLAFKEHVVAQTAARPQCERIPVAADLGGDWPTALACAGFEPNEQTAWLAEGLLIYLTQEAADHLLECIGNLSAQESRLALEHVSQSKLDAMRQGYRSSTGTDFSQMWQSGLAGDPAEWLARFGWQPDVYETTERAAAYGRPLQNGSNSFAIASNWLISASRRRA